MNLRRAADLAPLPAAFALGACAARVLLRHVPARYAVDLAQPFVIVTAWGACGAIAFAILTATLACATIALVVAARRHARGEAPGETGLVLSVAAATIAAALAWPFAFSSDVYAYAAYGAMLRAALDPYALLPAHVHGAFFDAARWQWSGTYPVCVYGPASLLVPFAAVALLGQAGTGLTLFALRVLTAGAFLASVALLARVLRPWPAPHRTIGLYAYGLNPVVLWSVAEGHNDAWLLLAATGALAVAASRPRAGAFLLGLTLLWKAPGAAFTLAAAADARIRRRPAGAALVGTSVAGLFAGAVLWLPLMVPAVAAIGRHGTYAPAVSVQGLTGPAVAGVLAVAAAAYATMSLWRGERTGYAWLGIAAIVALPNDYPWYALWLVPFALAAGTSRPAFALWAATIAAMVRYLPDAVGYLDPSVARIASLVATVPLLYALTGRRAVAHSKKAPVQ